MRTETCCKLVGARTWSSPSWRLELLLSWKSDRQGLLVQSVAKRICFGNQIGYDAGIRIRETHLYSRRIGRVFVPCIRVTW
jgi:hypothetical protein